MHVFILGGDGFCGWPTALHLSKLGYEITIIDNLSRRHIDIDLEVESLTPIRPLRERLTAWREVSNQYMDWQNFTIGENFERLVALLKERKPDAIVHFAEQRAAPYSMKSSEHKRYTVRNNICATNDVCAAIVEAGIDCHMVHLGTMGVYGYGKIGGRIPEGYLKVAVDTDSGPAEREILYPPKMNTCTDSLLRPCDAKGSLTR